MDFYKQIVDTLKSLPMDLSLPTMELHSDSTPCTVVKLDLILWETKQVIVIPTKHGRVAYHIAKLKVSSILLGLFY